MYSSDAIYKAAVCAICGEPKLPNSVFCAKHGDEFNAWYRLGMKDWAQERKRRGMTIGSEALVEWANEFYPRSVCAVCDKATMNDYLCPECRRKLN